MAIDTKYRHDVGVNFYASANTGVVGKATLALSSGGDLRLASGSEKLQQQIARRIASAETIIPLNEASVKRELKTLIALTLLNFIDTQIEDTDSLDPNLIGFNLYKLKNPSGFNRDTQSRFTKINTDPITHKFVDTDVVNNTSYTYGISRVFTGGIEFSITEKLVPSPSAFTSRQTVLISNSVSVFQKNAALDFYFNTNRIYKKSELLLSIESIDVRQSDTDPRAYIIDVSVLNLLQNKLDFADTKQALY